MEVKTVTSIIYEANGRAREYSELAANLYRGCSHGCTYCYAPSATFRNRVDFSIPSVRRNVIEQLIKDAEELQESDETRSILLSFTTDPYQPIDVDEKLTRQAIKILHEHNLKVEILTKGGKRSERDFDLLSKNPELSCYGTTIVFTNEKLRTEIEPFAATTKERIEALKKAHEMGISTFVSLEPVWVVEQTLEIIDLTHNYVDLYKVGKLNYNKKQSEIDWKQFREDAINKLSQFNKNFYIKNDLRKL
ncbi:radical SAM domain-containing protein [Methanolobus psychrophilus R15]|nr:radical SAM domain-containing protein [Methanolobus psychrophilus R15]